jgi:hypothetical protein
LTGGGHAVARFSFRNQPMPISALAQKRDRQLCGLSVLGSNFGAHLRALRGLLYPLPPVTERAAIVSGTA